MRPRILFAGFYSTQFVAIAAWWLLLYMFPILVDHFKPASFDDDFFGAFIVPDAALAGCSLSAAVAMLMRARMSLTLVKATALLAVYPTLYCVALSSLTGEAWLASGLMSTMLFANYIACSIFATQDSSHSIRAFRAVERSVWNARLTTVVQICIFWTYFLYILPKTIASVEQLVNIPQFAIRAVWPILLLLLASALGLWSGFTMATAGKGTPLPTDAAPQLVVTGPYRFVRNPMAIAGLWQGIAIGLLLGSPMVVILSVLCCVGWHVLVRPAEERDLAERFGDSFARYKATVPLWFPKISSS